MSVMRRGREIEGRLAGALDEPRLSVAPLIDVCFLLLIFFVATTTIKLKETDVTIEGGDREPSSEVRLPIFIGIRGEGEIVLNPGKWEIPVSVDPAEHELPKLEDHLKIVMTGQREEPPVVVRVEDEARHQRVVDVMNTLQKVGLQRVGFVDE